MIYKDKLMLKRCPECMGRKKVPGLGMILQDCLTCDKSGFVEDMPILQVGEKVKRKYQKAIDALAER